MFYLLKGTNGREETGDILVNKSAVQSIQLAKVITKDETYYMLKVHMNEGDCWKVCFNTEEEARNALENLVCSEQVANEYFIKIVDQEKRKKDKIEDVLRNIMQ